MTYYTAHYGNWNDPEGVRKVGETNSRSKIMEWAQMTANKTGKAVTVMRKTGTCAGLYVSTVAVVAPKN